VGYTNAGKSTLFNALTKAGSYAADQLFATLDTTTRSIYLGDGVPQVVLSDTVGFIRDLPHKLVEAFKATLQEASEAQLLLHVIDANSPKLHEQWAEVERVLDEIGVTDTPQVVVFNKIDALPEHQQPRSRLDWVERPDGTRVARVFLSAHSGEGLADLRQLLARAALDEALIPDVLPAVLPPASPVTLTLNA
jgi:GTP-binding protein HflX